MHILRENFEFRFKNRFSFEKSVQFCTFSYFFIVKLKFFFQNWLKCSLKTIFGEKSKVGKFVMLCLFLELKQNVRFLRARKST